MIKCPCGREHRLDREKLEKILQSFLKDEQNEGTAFDGWYMAGHIADAIIAAWKEIVGVEK